jgi:hypothetical protein
MFRSLPRAIFSWSAILQILVPFVLSAQQSWVQIPTPDPSTTRNLLRGISGTSSSDVWAVGHYNPTPSEQKNLVIHWDGSGWQQLFPADPDPANNDLWDVAAITTDDVWIAGTHGSAVQPQLIHWDGSGFSPADLPPLANTSFLWSLHALSTNAIWAVGGRTQELGSTCYSLLYDGSDWDEISVPAVGALRNRFVAVHGTSSNNVWAVGSWGNSLGDFRFLAMRWNGSAWMNIPLPANELAQMGELHDVAVIGENDVWVMGGYTAGGLVIMHWDGSDWTVVPNAGGGGAFAALATDNIYAVGERISHWDGSAWSEVLPFSFPPYKALHSTTTLPDGEVWAAGSMSDDNGIFYTLVYRGEGLLTSIPVTVSENPNGPYPIPFNDRVFVEGTSDANITIELFDLTGKHVLASSYANDTGTIILNTQDVLPGNYLLTVRSMENITTYRVMKE